MAEELGDHRQGFAEGERLASDVQGYLSAVDAKEWRQSRSCRSWSLTRAQISCQESSRLCISCPGTLPGITCGLPSMRDITAGTLAASDDSEIVRGPVLMSGRRR